MHLYAGENFGWDPIAKTSRDSILIVAQDHSITFHDHFSKLEEEEYDYTYQYQIHTSLDYIEDLYIHHANKMHMHLTLFYLSNLLPMHSISKGNIIRR